MSNQDLARGNTIGDAVRRAADRFRDREALVFADRSWSFAGLDLAADRVARRLAALGLRHGDRVGAFGRNSDSYLLLWLGCLRGGFVHVPINFALTGPELDFILTQCGASALIAQAALADAAEAARGRTGVAIGGVFDGATDADGADLDILAAALDPVWGAPGDKAPNEAVRDTDLAQLLYTAGTTGRPKGAMMTHGALLAEYASCIAGYGYDETERSLAALPLYHSAQMHVAFMPSLLTGGFCHLIGAPDAETVLMLMERERITCFFSPPTVWIALLRHPDFDRRDLSLLKKLIYGAAIMPVPVLQELRRRLPSGGPYNSYGQSEIGPLATLLLPHEHEARPGSVGRAVLNVSTRVVDTDMNDCAPGVPGEIVHRSPQLLLGYWGMPDETGRAFAGGWFHSGDIGTIDAEGYIAVVDRVHDLINTGGVMVSSREIEEVLFTHPLVAEVAVIAVPDPKWIEAVAAIVVLRKGLDVPEGLERLLIEHARASLAAFKLPKRIFVVDGIPKSTAGKLLKRELRVQYAAIMD